MSTLETVVTVPPPQGTHAPRFNGYNYTPLGNTMRSENGSIPLARFAIPPSEKPK